LATIAGADRQDERGSTAKAIEVFRDRAIENRRLPVARQNECDRA